MTLDDEELSDLRKCRPGDCGLKLSAGEMRQILDGMTGAGSAWRPRSAASCWSAPGPTRAAACAARSPTKTARARRAPDAEFEEIAALTDVAAIRSEAPQVFEAFRRKLETGAPAAGSAR